MISISELIDPLEYKIIPEDHRLNLSHLHYRLNLFRKIINRPLIITSGYRTYERHKAIYDKKNQERLKKGLSAIKIPTESLHLIGAAADIADPVGTVKAWAKANPRVLEDCQLWCEHWDACPGWMHIQALPPTSGLRWFLP